MLRRTWVFRRMDEVHSEMANNHEKHVEISDMDSSVSKDVSNLSCRVWSPFQPPSAFKADPRKISWSVLSKGLAGACGINLRIVSPALPDDQDSPSTRPSVTGWSQSGRYCSQSSEAVGIRSPDAASASDAASGSFLEILSTLTPKTTIGTTLSHL